MKQLNHQLLAELLDKRMADDQADGRVGGAGLCVMQNGQEVYKKYRKTCTTNSNYRAERYFFSVTNRIHQIKKQD